ncbi:MAG: PIN domain-containing protein [Prevotellaceae bacterium]|jgi:predicted nucleic acid-binding protein|nr:PIN domain-containing protein [Prevotellaceae bacterium]
MKVYLDNCSYNRPFDDQSQIRIYLETQAKLHIQKSIRDGRLQLAFSYISRYENGNSPHTSNKTTIERFFKNAVTFVDIDKANMIENKAKEIMKYGVKAKDALHIACAIEAKCDYFITTDDGILKKYKAEDINVCSPVNFINIIEDSYVLQHSNHNERGYELPR